MLELADHWVWDSWLADDGERFHIFFLRASRALLDPERRHARASVGHAVSDDLRSWTLLPDALVPGDPGDFDDQAIWTGSVVRDDAGLWHMLYTARQHGHHAQRIGHATSPDLVTWTRHPAPVAQADARWYETQDTSTFGDEPFRDPWVFRHEGQWHMTVTARVPHGPTQQRGVFAHAVSADLRTWQVGEPLLASSPFGELEVSQVVNVDGHWMMIFSCGERHVSPDAPVPAVTGMYCVPADSPLGPFHMDRVELVSELYAGKVVQDRAGHWQLLGFHGYEDGRFVGAISDPVPLVLSSRGTLTAAV